MSRPRFLIRPLVLSVMLALAACSAESPESSTQQHATVTGESPLVGAFVRASLDTGVPAELLASLAYVETRFSQSVGYDSDLAHGAPRAHGVMALSVGPARDVARAARLAGVTVEDLRRDPAVNVLAAARLLAAYARDHYGEVPGEVEAYRPVLARFAGDDFTAITLAHDVLSNLERGIIGIDDDGLRILVPARTLRGIEAGIGQSSQALGFAGAIWNAAYSGNFQSASRGAAQINNVVIHTTQGSYAGTISWFKNPDANVSSHYVVRSSDGQITQMVDDSDVAWHDACFNTNSIGIEHEGFVADPGRWYTEAMYTQSARLTAWLCDQYGIPKDRAHIQGHGETADCSDHTDPGSGWNWTRYMDLVRGGGQPTAPAYQASLVGKSDLPVLAPGEEAVAWVEYKNDGSATWDINNTRLGTTEPQDRDSAFFKDGNWLAKNRATGADHSYAPGAVGRFSFVVKAPAVAQKTVFHEKFRLVQEGTTWFAPAVELTITVEPEATVTTPGPVPGQEPGTAPEAEGEAGGACDIGGGPGSARGAAGAGGAALVLLVIGLGVLLRSRKRAAD